MHLVSINLGQLRTITNDGPPRTTGIFKYPVQGPVRLTREHLEGDVIVSTKHHGGPDQAVYVYGEPDYAWWARELGCKLTPGTFGDNLTVAGFESANSCVGDRLHVGDVVIEITAPRIPCGNLAARMEDARFPQRFRAAERPGVYCRVLHEGTVRVGDPVRHEAVRADTVTVLELFRDHYAPADTVAAINRFLAAPIAHRARVKKEKQLRARVQSGPSG